MSTLIDLNVSDEYMINCQKLYKTGVSKFKSYLSRPTNSGLRDTLLLLLHFRGPDDSVSCTFTYVMSWFFLRVVGLF